MIYTINGDGKEECYNINGENLEQCYDINGNPLLIKDRNIFKIMSYNVGSWTSYGRPATIENQGTWYRLQNNILLYVNCAIFPHYVNQ